MTRAHACVCAWRVPTQARAKQVARLVREEKLATLPLALAGGKRALVRDLQVVSRVVVVAGTQAQVAAAVEAAEPYREALVERGVFLVTAPIFGARGGSVCVCVCVCVCVHVTGRGELSACA